ncbi:hypothetical protein HPB48_005157 [Haemaphysalis longicornis]|uniref:Uncharacterized protein n=1 Tax=Haemaphysalis longicornis TaxID=44386 RepID=A0A9J6FF57_HAELO|nr:hypothetical protein HPB48_005157 [Haemaphysalis longicornis]
MTVLSTVWRPPSPDGSALLLLPLPLQASKGPMVAPPAPHPGSPLNFMVYNEPFSQPPPAHMGIPPVHIDPKTGKYPARRSLPPLPALGTCSIFEARGLLLILDSGNETNAAPPPSLPRPRLPTDNRVQCATQLPASHLLLSPTLINLECSTRSRQHLFEKSASALF